MATLLKILTPMRQQSFSQNTVKHTLTTLGLVMAGVVVYFCWLDRLRRRHIRELVAYIQNLSERIYNLKLK